MKPYFIATGQFCQEFLFVFTYFVIIISKHTSKLLNLAKVRVTWYWLSLYLYSCIMHVWQLTKKIDFEIIKIYFFLNLWKISFVHFVTYLLYIYTDTRLLNEDLYIQNVQAKIMFNHSCRRKQCMHLRIFQKSNWFFFFIFVYFHMNMRKVNKILKVVT